MEAEIGNFKNAMIEEIRISYEINKRALTLNYNKDVYLLSRLRNRNNIRAINVAIISLTQSYNTNIRTLTEQFNVDVKKIMDYVINIPVQTNSHNNKKMALLIGINYQGTENELFGCINDANNIKELITEKGFTDIRILTDDALEKPTKQNIIDHLKTILTNAASGDTIVFSYSGHGSYIFDKNNEEKDGRDELIIPLDLNPILDDELKNIIQNNLKEGVTMFALFDSCFSGTVLDLKYQYLDSTNYDNFTENNNNLETLGNVCMISGCMDSQTSVDAYINNKPQGAMTWSFLESLKTLENPTWRELVKNMRDILKINGLEQIPQFSSGKVMDIDAKVTL